jgi:hypothetical protein
VTRRRHFLSARCSGSPWTTSANRSNDEKKHVPD